MVPGCMPCARTTPSTLIPRPISFSDMRRSFRRKEIIRSGATSRHRKDLDLCMDSATKTSMPRRSMSRRPFARQRMGVLSSWLWAAVMAVPYFYQRMSATWKHKCKPATTRMHWSADFRCFRHSRRHRGSSNGHRADLAAQVVFFEQTACLVCLAVWWTAFLLCATERRSCVDTRRRKSVPCAGRTEAILSLLATTLLYDAGVMIATAQRVSVQAARARADVGQAVGRRWAMTGTTTSGVRSRSICRVGSASRRAHFIGSLGSVWQLERTSSACANAYYTTLVQCGRFNVRKEHEGSQRIGFCSARSKDIR